MRILFDYTISFETDGRKLRMQKQAFNIHNIINEVRKEYPDAGTFIVIKKVKSLAPIG